MSRQTIVLLVEDHPASGDALVEALRKWFLVPNRVGSLPELPAAIRLQRPDVVLLDLALGEKNALESLPELVDRFAKVAFIVLTAYDSYFIMEGAIGAGARGFVPKSATLAEIRVSIEEVAAGRDYYHPGVRRPATWKKGAGTVRGPGQDDLVTPKPAEVEVLTLLREGFSGRAAARRLGIHHRTVEQRLARIRRALGGIPRVSLLRWFEEWIARRED